MLENVLQSITLQGGDNPTTPKEAYMTELKVKEWFIDKEQDKASSFNIYFQYARRTEGNVRTPLREDGCVYVSIEEELGESEKAVHVKIASGDVVGSGKGWKVWIPKSVIVR